MAENKKVYTEEEIHRMAPNYKCKPENFNPARVGKKSPKPVGKPRLGLKFPVLPAPTNLQTKATPQRNESILTDAIFGIDVSVVKIAPMQSFSANYSKIIEVAAEVYDDYRSDDRQLDRVMMREEVAYYATAMLHLKLLEVKAKQGIEVLTSKEQDMRKAVNNDMFNVPQPLFGHLDEIGMYTDKMGKETLHEIPPLPVTVVENFGGYHAVEVSVATQNLFEEESQVIWSWLLHHHVQNHSQTFEYGGRSTHNLLTTC